MDDTKAALQRAIALLGGPSEAGRRLGVTAQTVCNWTSRGRQIPVAVAVAMERVSDGAIRVEDICPGIDWQVIRAKTALHHARRAEEKGAVMQTKKKKLTTGKAPDTIVPDSKGGVGGGSGDSRDQETGVEGKKAKEQESGGNRGGEGVQGEGILSQSVKPKNSRIVKPGTRIPDGCPTAAMLNWASVFFPQVDLAIVAPSFRDYWLAKTGQDSTKLDWFATWRNWVRNEATRYAKTGRELRLVNRDKVAAQIWGEGHHVERDISPETP